MAQSCSVKVGSRYQIALPSAARQRLSIQRGDRLQVDIQDGCLILLPEPHDHVTRLEGLHSRIWEGVDTEDYLQQEHAAWDGSAND